MFSAHITVKRCVFTVAAEQKARVTYDNILRLSDVPDVNDVIRFLREKLDQKNVYYMNPALG
mgnify:CR=1 FL=1